MERTFCINTTKRESQQSFRKSTGIHETLISTEMHYQILQENGIVNRPVVIPLF